MSSTTPSDSLQRALRLHQDGQLDAAAELYREILRGDPACADAAHLLGLIALHRGALDEAVERIQAAIRANPLQAVYHFNLGNVFKRRGQPTEAAASYRAALALQPDDADTLNNLGSVLQDCGDVAEAVRCFARAHELAPDDVQILGNLGAALFELDRLDEAARCFERAIALDTEFAEAHNNLGAVWQSRGDFEQARQSYERALRAAPEFASAHKNLAGVLHLLGRNDEAIAHYRETLRLQPDFAEATYELAALTGTTRAAPPRDYVAGMFDQYAHEYDEHMTGVLGYGVPRQLRALLEPLLPSRTLDILDLGCGTGLSGAVFQDVARMLVGVDLSPKMIAHARERGIYSELIVGDVVDETRRRATPFDLVLAADVFVYLGDLAPVFAVVHDVLRARGLFAFSVERGEGAAYELRAAGRYAHGGDYVATLARRSGFDLLICHDTVLRQDYGKDIAGTLWVLQHQGAST